MKNRRVTLALMLTAALLPIQVFAEEEAFDKPLLEEISNYRQLMQHENVRVQYLEAKKRRMELELDIETVGDTVPLPVVSDSTSFSDVESMPLSATAPDQALTPPTQGAVASWGQQLPVTNYDAFPEYTPPKQEPKVRLLEVVGFSDSLKAVIAVDSRKITVRNGDKVRGAKIEITSIHHDHIRFMMDGAEKVVDFNQSSSGSGSEQSESNYQPQTSSNGVTTFGSGVSFPSMDEPGM